MDKKDQMAGSRTGFYKAVQARKKQNTISGLVKRYPMSVGPNASFGPKKEQAPVKNKIKQYGDKGYKPSNGVGVGY